MKLSPFSHLETLSQSPLTINQIQRTAKYQSRQGFQLRHQVFLSVWKYFLFYSPKKNCKRTQPDTKVLRKAPAYCRSSPAHSEKDDLHAEKMQLQNHHII